MQIQFNSPFQDFTGNDILNTNQGKFLAEAIAGGSTPNPVKFYDWACAMYHGRDFHLDQVDAESLKTWIEGHPSMSTSAKAQLIGKIKAAIEKAARGPKE